jgi:hypothetical protein
MGLENKFSMGEQVELSPFGVSTFEQDGWADYRLPLLIHNGALANVIKIEGDKVWVKVHGEGTAFFYEDHLKAIGNKLGSSSIARPILEERKVGKVQMDLFDSGFPNAVMEVAKVMTWAAENKGYKPHDWVNLPDAETSFPSAASRHRVKSLIQKVEGLPAGERVDEESAILHKAHEAFNILAELELMLRGKIK